MKTILTGSIFLAFIASFGAFAAEEDNHGKGMNHAAMQGMMAAEATIAQMHKGHGKVNKVDIQDGKINMTHGPIKSLGWAGMTMDFKVKDKAILNNIKPGQMVDFDVAKDGSGLYYVNRISPLK